MLSHMEKVPSLAHVSNSSRHIYYIHDTRDTVWYTIEFSAKK
jgi:hypothetical protein